MPWILWRVFVRWSNSTSTSTTRRCRIQRSVGRRLTRSSLGPAPKCPRNWRSRRAMHGQLAWPPIARCLASAVSGILIHRLGIQPIHRIQGHEPPVSAQNQRVLRRVPFLSTEKVVEQKLAFQAGIVLTPTGLYVTKRLRQSHPSLLFVDTHADSTRAVAVEFLREPIPEPQQHQRYPCSVLSEDECQTHPRGPDQAKHYEPEHLADRHHAQTEHCRHAEQDQHIVRRDASQHRRTMQQSVDWRSLAVRHGRALEDPGDDSADCSSGDRSNQVPRGVRISLREFERREDEPTYDNYDRGNREDGLNDRLE